jgi:hypothetical protein
MERTARLAAFGLGGLLIIPYSETFLKMFAAFLVMTLGLHAIFASMTDDPARARTNLIAALGLIVLIETLAPLDWRALIR